MDGGGADHRSGPTSSRVDLHSQLAVVDMYRDWTEWKRLEAKWEEQEFSAGLGENLGGEYAGLKNEVRDFVTKVGGGLGWGPWLWTDVRGLASKYLAGQRVRGTLVTLPEKELRQIISGQYFDYMFTAAVADFSPTPPAGKGKFKKAGAPEGFSIAFRPNPDILQTLAAGRRPEQKVLAFAAETTPDVASLLPLAHAKRARKGADVLAANRVNAADSGFGSPTNSMAVVDASGAEALWPVQSKADVAWDLCSWLLRI